MNNKQGTYVDVQRAIWTLLGKTIRPDFPAATVPGQGGDATVADTLLRLSLPNTSFVPGPGQVLGLIAIQSAPSQPLMMELPVPSCPYKIGDFVWSDTNANGIQDGGEPGINGVTVRLLSATGSLLATTTTNTNMSQNGWYEFGNLMCGTTYQVQVDTASAPLAGMVRSPEVGTPNTALDSNPNPAIVTITQGADLTIDFGFYTPIPCTGQIGDFVFNDKNANGIQDGLDAAIGSVKVLLSGPGGLSTFAITDGNGKYSFMGLCAGSYTVSVDNTTIPAGFLSSTPGAPGSTTADDSNPNPTTVVLTTSSSIDNTIDFGYHAPCDSALGDVVWSDLNANGIQDPGEPGLNGVMLELRNSLNVVLGTATTTQIGSVNGSYLFSGLCAGMYTVKVVSGVPTNYVPTTPTAPGSTTSNDSNGSPADVTLPQSTTDRTVDFGFVPPCEGVIGDFVWNDVNANGIQDTGELPLTGFTVNLRKASDNSVLQTTTTSTGPGPNYKFMGLCTGSYRVEVIPQTGYVASPTGAGTPTTDSNPNAAPVTLPANNASDLTIDFGYYQAPISSCVSFSAVQNRAITAIQLPASGGAGAPYTFLVTGLPTGLVVSASGLITGTPSVSGTFPYNIKVTDRLGNIGSIDCSVTVHPPITSSCVFIGANAGIPITPVQLPASGGAGGPYTFTATGLPNGLVISTGGVISGTPTVGGSFPYVVTITDKNGNTGTLNCTVNVGIPDVVCTPGTFTLTGNSSTTGTAGNIRTFTASNGTLVKASAFSRIKTTGAWSTAYLGAYGPGLGVTDGSEDGSDPGHKVDNVGTRTNYVMLEFSSPVIVNRAFLDSVSSDSDITVWVGTKTDPYNNHLTLSDALLSSLTMEEDTTTLTTSRWAEFNGARLQGNVVIIAALVSDTSAEDNFKLSKIDTTCPGTTTCTGTAGNFVWKDLNGNGIQDGTTETGISGVTLQLKNSSSAVVATTVTDANGAYQFTAACGTYTVVIPTSPTGYTASPSLAGTNRAVDSNGSATAVTLSATADQTVDFGFVPAGPVVCAPGTFTLTGNSGTTGTAGNIRTFTGTNGVQVKASAFSRNKTSGAWATAYLGSYGPGLGVTDGSENGSAPGHTVDNVGSHINYVLFEFSSPVVINRAFLDSVTSDSDITVWVGTRNNPFTSHVALNDSVLAGLTKEENATTLTSARWADINSGNLEGNFVVIAAMVSDTTPEDQFKLSKLETSCPSGTTTCTGKIGNLVWKDSSGNGLRESTEVGLGSVILQLKQGSTVLKSVATDTTGFYQFSGLCAGTYTVVAPVVPTGYSASPSLVGTNRAVDSNGSGTTVTLATNTTEDLTVDFGYVPQAACVATTYTLTGSSATDGTNGNIRTFTAPNGAQVKASAFSRNKSNGAWSTAWLGAYGSGLGVTNNAEDGSDPGHRLDNVGSNNDFVLFEFSSNVVVDKAFLDYVGADSDLTVWIGKKTNPFTNHLSLNDSVLASLGTVEESLTSSPDSRWADLNSGAVEGNVLVIAAWLADTTGEDEFKLSKILTACK
ncbi:MAG: SdrD B-like domain-containing protein [Bryobacteraceae bacterium]|nr:SdrD B-like domain-containing protein [Bryobacteraceae bacterium]